MNEETKVFDKPFKYEKGHEQEPKWKHGSVCKNFYQSMREILSTDSEWKHGCRPGSQSCNEWLPGSNS